ncbi:hypothetical protein ACFY5H_34290 [Streptomyces sp. NPDC013012]|uniref:hypothetical protein n=1 Tax=Streptomyces sp. NPDC013012 TaxID=3364860 RepID=UPI00369A19B4
MNHHTNRRVVTAVLISAVTAALAACGPVGSETSSKNSAGLGSGPTAVDTKDPFGGLTGAQISDKSKTALQGATSIRFTGDAPNPLSTGTFALDIAMDVTGSCRGTVTIPGRGTLKVIKGRDLVHVQGDERYWRASLATAKKKPDSRKADAFLEAVQGRWLKMSANTAKGFGISSMCDLSTMTKQFKGDSPETTKRGADVTRNGQRLAVVYDRDGHEVVTTYISKNSRPYPVEITVTGGNAPAALKLTDYDKPIDTTPPPADQTITPEDLGLTASSQV